MSVDWDSIFTGYKRPKLGIDAETLEAKRLALFSPFTPGERAEMYELVQGDSDESRLEGLDERVELWTVPWCRLPDDYLDLLQWSNGGDFENGDRYIRFFEFYGDIRSKMVDHAIPEYVPGLLPFGSDAGSRIYCFDTREAVPEGELPIASVPLGVLDFEWVKTIAPNFLDFCRDPRPPGDLE